MGTPREGIDTRRAHGPGCSCSSCTAADRAGDERERQERARRR